ncbi:MAG: hypothetical protein JO060_11470 [Candidatus Eremiobacteraeota bacterium]|nr:hypothetical protein [Candidatus Eremiobacteraeota bacterium]
MSSNHARFEAVAGAIALGEASPSEHAIFSAHAQNCSRCAGLERAGPSVASFVHTALHEETWRPFVREAVIAGIESLHLASGRRTALWICTAVCVTLFLNLVLAAHVGLPSKASTTSLARTSPRQNLVARMPQVRRHPPRAADLAVLRATQTRLKPALDVERERAFQRE